MIERGDDFDGTEPFSHLQDACAAMVRNARLLLRRSGEAINTTNVLRVIGSAPRDEEDREGYFWREKSYCKKLLDRIWDRCWDDGSLHIFQMLHRYWWEDFTDIDPVFQRRMIEAAYGILGAVDSEGGEPMFIRDSCATMARNACELLELAGEPITGDAILEIVKSVPFSSSDFKDGRWLQQRCNQTLSKAHGRTQDTPDWPRYRKLFFYFTTFIPNRRPEDIDTLIGVFEGVLGELTFINKEIAPPPPRRSWRVLFTRRAKAQG